MERLAQLLWNPFLGLWYIAISCLFVFVTGAIAWRKSRFGILSAWSLGRRTRKTGELSHRRALLTALAAGVGVGNLAGVATALHLGGPGALFWMWVSALLGMSVRMSSTYLAIRFRPRDKRSVLFATPMAYLERFLSGRLKMIPLLISFLILCKGFVTANLTQSNSVAQGLNNIFSVPSIWVSVLLSLAVVLVIVGGIQSISRFSEFIAPWMLLVYIISGVLILGQDPSRTFQAFTDVFQYAFQPYSILGGAVGYTVFQALQFGVSRGVFSHGSGMGIAPFLQGYNTDHPSRGAFMAALVPVIDTLVICTITGLVILSKGQWQLYTSAHLTISSFVAGLGASGKYIVSFCLVTFAFTTMINWAHYSERCYHYLGGRNTMVFRLVFAAVTFIGPFFPVALVWSLGDVLIGVLVVVHLLPLVYIVLKNRTRMMKDLGSVGSLAGTQHNPKLLKTKDVRFASSLFGSEDRSSTGFSKFPNGPQSG